ncbi:gustatory receptor for sugar taste 64e-like [Anopheles merus]|uniref:gustatory receptor for sugar taste 64e-like n=1 Tax=Anopheles merus TaxID=30066 RepID=UPI001BE4282F|nr:gustatory receptor for sugar taste 64e-like [Anopheles merus]
MLSKTVRILEKEFYQPPNRPRFINGGGYFCRSIQPVLIVGQMFGLLPLDGVWCGRWWSIHWRLLSWRNLYALFVQLSALIMACFSFATFWYSGVEFAKIMSWWFFTLNLLISINFAVLARNWPQLMSRWPRLSAACRRNARQVGLVATVLLTSGLIEHVLSKPAGLHRAYRCPIPNLLEAHYKQAFPEMFSFVPYNPYVGFLAQTITSLLTVYWNYVDLFLISVSVGLRTNLAQVNDVIASSEKLYHRGIFWKDQCTHYRRVLGLIRHVNNHIGVFIVISYASNLFFICVQLVNVFQQNSSFIVTSYFWYSLFHLIGRIVAVSLYGSAIHDEYCRTRALFYNLPDGYGYTDEVQRFHRQVEHDSVALNGYGFFYLTRKLILKIAATVVTYELVLTQVNEAEAKNGDDNPCT